MRRQAPLDRGGLFPLRSRGQAISTGTRGAGCHRVARATECVPGRTRFVNGLCDGRPGIDRFTVEGELEQIAAETADREDPKESQADKLVALADEAKVFHTPGGYDSDGYNTVRVENHSETWPVDSKPF